jgi:1-acyl-sn-glycerol-3-phosphate acyltransferase
MSREAVTRARAALSLRVRRATTWLFFEESLALRRVGLAGMPNGSRVWYLFSCAIAVVFFRTWTKWERVGLDNLPKSGGVIMVSNHLSSADPPMLASAMYPRWPKFMAKIELLQKGFIGYLFAMCGVFPVRRFEADLGALREAQRLLARGEIVGVLPEGHRSDTAEMNEAYPGAALIALRSGAPVLPVAITGSQELRKGWGVFIQRPRMRVVFGEPFWLRHEGATNRDVVEAAHTRIMREIAGRLPAAYRGVYRERFPDLPDEALLHVPPAGGTEAAP